MCFVCVHFWRALDSSCMTFSKGATPSTDSIISSYVFVYWNFFKGINHTFHWKKARPNAQLQETIYSFQDLVQKVPYCLDDNWIYFYVHVLFWRTVTHCKLVWGFLLALCSFLYALLTYSSCTPEILFMQWPGFCLFLNIVQSPTTYTWSKIASSILFLL